MMGQCVTSMTRTEKNRAYRTRRALNILRRKQPKTVEEARSMLGMPAILVGSGSFRNSYRIGGTTLLIKFPVMCFYAKLNVSHDHEGKNHTRMEVKKIRVLMEFPFMRKHLPPILYFNSRDGVLVTRFYKESGRDLYEQKRNFFISDMVKEFCGVVLNDLTQDNVKVGKGGIVFIDLGY